jgi:hypothetical protein
MCGNLGRALGEVTKFLVYNARKRQEGGDAAATYFERTECVAGVQDARFQQLMPDVIHWLGLQRAPPPRPIDGVQHALAARFMGGSGKWDESHILTLAARLSTSNAMWVVVAGPILTLTFANNMKNTAGSFTS